MSASLWGCELKFKIFIPRLSVSRVSLLVRLWVEIMRISDTGVTSIGQPPCEAVSWNAPRVSTDGIILCQPPCEAVSWNVSSFVGRWVAGVVSLLVRLWVEIWWSYRHNNRKNVSLLVRLWVEIIVKVIGNYLALVSLLVRLWVEIMIRNLLWSVVIRQPPCEAVSWNIGHYSDSDIEKVSLLVRLWVEMSSICLFSSAISVSLLVRLWVEISQTF